MGSLRNTKLPGVFALGLALLIVSAISFVGSAQDATSVGVACVPDPVAVNSASTCTVTVTNTPTPTNGAPLGTVTVTGPTAGTGAISSDLCAAPGVVAATATTSTCTFVYTPDSAAVTPHTFSLSYVSSDITATGWANSSGSGAVGVSERTTTTVVSACTTPLSVNQAGTCTVTVTDTATPPTSTPVGTVALTDSTGNGTFGACALSAANPATCTVSFTPTSASTHTITATYTPGTTSVGVHASSTDGAGDPVTVNARTTATALSSCTTPLFVSETGTCDVTVTDTATAPKSNPQGTMSFSDSTTDGTFSTCALVPFGTDAATCVVNFTPTAASTHLITATYTAGGSSTGVHGGSSDVTITPTVTVNLRTTQTDVSCSITTVFIDQTTVCTATVTDIAGAGIASIPSGTVTFGDAGKVGTFSAATCALDPTGKCSVSYTPGAGDAGTTTITAAYASSTVHLADAGTQDLTVNLRTTTSVITCVDSAGGPGALLVDEPATCTTTVTDVAAGTKSAPAGTVTPSVVTGGGGVSVSACSALAPASPLSTCDFTHTHTDIPAGNSVADTDTAAYGGSTTHAASSGSIGVAVIKRSSTMTLSCTSADPSTCTATLTDAGINRPTGASVPTGEVADSGGISFSPACIGTGCTFSVTAAGLNTMVTARYLGSGKHIETFATFLITRTITTTAGTVTDVAALIAGNATTCAAMDASLLAMDAAGLVASVIPDVVIVALFGGTSIPVGPIAEAVITAAQIAVTTSQLIICADFDGDGLAAPIETTLGLSDTNDDVDGDGMSDSDEITNAGGTFEFGYVAILTPVSGTCPNPLTDDSDIDGLVDGDEQSLFPTNFCAGDTDGDALKDGEEVTGVAPYSPTLPNVNDTDGDGISDGVEVGANGVSIGISAVDADPTTTTDPNDADTDKDGLLDGQEDTNGNGFIDSTICDVAATLAGGCTSVGTESDPNSFDTDGDDLGDGFELGSGSGCSLILADTDGDGLSDSEEVNITQTSCSVADSDGDTLSDSDEFIVTAGTFPTRTLQQVSDPLSPDTDSDSIPDNLEFAGSGIGTGTIGVTDTACPFVNNGDSDGDGLPDGWSGAGFLGEDLNNNGVFNGPGALGNSITQATAGETDFCNPDTDSDGVSDGDEFSLFGPQGIATSAGSTVTPVGATATIPALDDDSDNDGLSEWEEVNASQTDPLDSDSDDDTLSDANELVATGTFPKRTFVQISDPLIADTDGDSIMDNIEFAGGTGLGITRIANGINDIVCPFVNNADSDADGLPDGAEDNGAGAGTAFDGVITNTVQIGVAGATLQGSGETNFCDADTDNDLLSDGDEVSLFGASVDPEGPAGLTVPANDSDSDNDSLSDSEELNKTNTNALDNDSDNDTLIDSNEELATGGTFPDRTGFTQASDPLIADTDGDSIPDNLEYPGTALGVLVAGSDDTTCPFVNDADSDGDGLPDGWSGPGFLGEDLNNNGVYDAVPIGNSTTQVTTGETDFCNPDTDNDEVSDGDEFSLFGPQGIATSAGSTVTPVGATATIPALDDDSDNDGLSEWEEVNASQTDPLDSDSDNDTLSDANELIASGTFPKRTFVQVSDPLIADTDGDSITDNLEFVGGTGLGITRIATGINDIVCPFVNDGDSDGDGLPDGWSGPGFLGEDLNNNGVYDAVAIGNSTTQVTTGETDFCNPDTDGDEVSDGDEFSLFGPQGITTSAGSTVTPVGATATIPALDDDSDNDGLSEWEEVNASNTDPLDSDSDNDTLSDANELVATGTFPKRTFVQASDPLDPNTDGDNDTTRGGGTGTDMSDAVEFPGGSGLGITRAAGGIFDTVCPFVTDDDSDNDGIQDGSAAGTFGFVEDFTDVPDTSFNNGDLFVGDTTPNVCDPDSDQDGLNDGFEVGDAATNPSDWDTDNDGLGDEIETNVTQTDPFNADSDFDNYGETDKENFNGFTSSAPSAAQFAAGLVNGTDAVCINDCFEVSIPFQGLAGIAHATNPLDPDTDDDGITEQDEDIDEDGVFGCDFTGNGSFDANSPDADPTNSDSDEDGIQDGGAVGFSQGLFSILRTFGADGHEEGPVDVAAGVGTLGVPNAVTPNSGEGQASGVADDALVNWCDPDSDGDNLSDGQELGIGTNIDDWDTDNDGRRDEEVLGSGPAPTDPFDPDTDDDGLPDGIEVNVLIGGGGASTNVTDPLDPDTDADGLCDGGEEARAVWFALGFNAAPAGTTAPVGTMAAPLAPVCFSGVGDHPNPNGFGEDRNGDGITVNTIGGTGTAGSGETSPEQPDTDGDGNLDGVEALAYSTSRSTAHTDARGRPTRAVYPTAANPPFALSCMSPLDSDSDDEGLSDGFEDFNHDGNWDFINSDFDFNDPLGALTVPDSEETNPCDADSDRDSDPGSVAASGFAGGNASDWDERNILFTNPLDFDSDNDLLDDGVEVAYVCPQANSITVAPMIDNDLDGLFNEDGPDGIDNDLDGLIDEDPVDFMFIGTLGSLDGAPPFPPNAHLDPNNRDSDFDGFIDGREDLNLNRAYEPSQGETDACFSPPIPVVGPIQGSPVDTDGDGFDDDDERAAGTSIFDPNDHPNATSAVDLDLDGANDDRLWLSDTNADGVADVVSIDINSDVLSEARIQIIAARDFERGDFDGDGASDDCKYVVVYIFANNRGIQERFVTAIFDFNCDLRIDKVEVGAG